ncbi:hypothetical protein [Nonlabens dokdonensis]|nr:hypothetical protein [Nonlabens dokdonensis]
MKWFSILPVLVGVVLFFTNDKTGILNDKIVAAVTGHLVLLGFLILILSKDKYPDERLLNLRHKAMAYAFMQGMLVVILIPLINFFFSSLLKVGLVTYFDGFGAIGVFFFQIVYLINYWRFKQEL